VKAGADEDEQAVSSVASFVGGYPASRQIPLENTKDARMQGCKGISTKAAARATPLA
jgi:hypothetical protein